MTVKELIRKLKSLDPKTLIVMSKDIEGNLFSPLLDLSEGFYEEESSWYGQFYDREWLDDEPYEIDTAGMKKCVTLWPTN